MPQLTTSEADYGRRYYTHYFGAGELYDWSSPGWRGFFTGVASHLRALLPGVNTVLDVGCAKGLLVQAMREGGWDASGIDVSSAAIAEAHDDVRDHLTVRSATEPIEGRYDLLTCIEVLEHLGPADAEAAVDVLTSATDRIVFSSTPGDFEEPTHVNVRPTADWMGTFASRGFFRRTDVDLSFISPWAVLLERGEPTLRDVVRGYETLLTPLRDEVLAKRTALLEAQRDLSVAAAGGVDDEVAQLRHEILRLRDHAIGAEATAGSARVAIARKEAEVEELRNSEAFRLMKAAIRPLAVAKRGVKKVLG